MTMTVEGMDLALRQFQNTSFESPLSQGFYHSQVYPLRWTVMFPHHNQVTQGSGSINAHTVPNLKALISSFKECSGQGHDSSFTQLNNTVLKSTYLHYKQTKWWFIVITVIDEGLVFETNTFCIRYQRSAVAKGPFFNFAKKFCYFFLFFQAGNQ